MSQVKVRQALETRLNAFATAKNLPVVWENKTTDVTTSHLKSVLFPAPTGNPSLGVEHKRYRGIYRVQVFLTEINKGPNVIESLAEELVAWFPRGASFVSNGVTVNIENTPSQSRIDYEGSWVFVTVEMSYRAETY